MANALDAVLRARAILRDVTPLKNDCGRACGGACCEPDEDGQGGMLLFPGEEALYAPLPGGFSLSLDSFVVPGALFLICAGRCDRENRPLACRLFPLLPKMKEGEVRAVRDGRAYAVCPLLPGGLCAFDPAFVLAVRQAGEILYACPEHRDFLDALHRFIRSIRTNDVGKS